MLFQANLEDLEKVYKEESTKIPASLTAQFTERLTKEEAVQQTTSAVFPDTPMVPCNDRQEQLLQQQKQRSDVTTQSSGKKTRCCRKCKRPMKGHSKRSCI